ncbi:histidinol dehydrogenase [Acidocella sp.]|uniref:histidinol dehydrogenase n=1 Tax=Acidocella sp. TaxID=50710 RepID=UPI002608ED42|nr:histidinol dehydrogenase [Acidocella sp.]
MKLLTTRQANFEAEFAVLMARAQPAPALAENVRQIIEQVRQHGDAALFNFSYQFDRVELTQDNIRVTNDELRLGVSQVPKALREALSVAARRIETFHRAQLPRDFEFSDDTGATLGMRWTPLDAVGLYVPGGKASYPSSVLMNAVPARVAGVRRVAMCVPTPDGTLNPLILAAASAAGVSEIYRVGGAQAVAAMAYGTHSIRAVDRIVGPGNAYVAEAKRQVFGRVGIDSIAGPSEVLIIADDGNNPHHIALDLLAQCEHDEEAQAILITDSGALASAVAGAVDELLQTLPRRDIAAESWHRHGAILLVQNWEEAEILANRIAPEHLQLMQAEPDRLFRRIRHAGAIFLGRHTPEAIGDYVAGPNHVLPTSGTARFASGLSVYDFMKRTTYLATPPRALEVLGPTAVALAEAEGLSAHAASVKARLQ